MNKEYTRNEIEGQVRYDNCISLGCYCGTASAMSKNGLRSFSGPFDWCTSELKSVLMMMENDFSDFMLKDNLQIVNNSKEFQDTSYNFVFPHEIVSDFEEEFSGIYRKYRKRIERFMVVINKPTLFLRTVRSAEEVYYINKNVEYIEQVIKRGNSQNKIVFLVNLKMPDITDDFTWFRLGIDNYSTDVFLMRAMFDSSSQLVTYCANDILSCENINSNRLYDENNLSLRVKSAIVAHFIKVLDGEIIRALEKFFPNVDNTGMYIWGKGKYGILMLNYVMECGIKINAIIDREKGGDINGKVVCSIEEIEETDIYIMVAVSSEVSVEEIIGRIKNIKGNAKVVTFAEVYDYLKVQGKLE